MYKILLIANDADLRDLVRGYIQKLNPQIEISEASDEKSALNIFTEQNIDCILLDSQLPDLNSLTLLEHIKNHFPNSVIPIIMLTGHGDEVIATNALKGGAVDYITKDHLSAIALKRSIAITMELAETKRSNLKAEKALRMSEARFRYLFESTSDLIFSLAPSGKIILANQAWFKFLGYTNKELKGHSFLEFIHTDNRAHCKALLIQLLSGKSFDNIELRFITKDHQLFIAEGNISSRVKNNKASVLSGSFRDITKQKAAEIESERLQLTLNSIAEGVISTNSQGQIDFMNPVAKKLTAWSLLEAQNTEFKNVFTIFDDERKEAPNTPITGILENASLEPSLQNALLINKNNERFAIQYTAASISPKNGKSLGTVIVFQDVTAARELAQKIHHQSIHDPLTGLYNRREFEAHLNRALESAQNEDKNHVLCFLDLDNFKVVNDTAGHIAGDALLKQVSELLTSHLRGTDTLARLGGDEFSIILNSCPLEKAQEISNTIIKALREQRFFWEGKPYEIGVSIGIVTIDSRSVSTSQVLSHADVACYTAKDRGRNQAATYQVDDNDATTVRRYGDLQVAASLHDALDNNKFILYAQAIKGLSDNSTHYELLIRLKEDDGTIKLPGAFIPAAERFNIIGAIDRWVIKTALRSYYSTFGDGQKANIAINLSGNSLTDDTLLPFILEEFKNTGVPPECVCFEITETAAISHLREALKLIDALKDHGCSIALDDFGSGMSSFTYLKQFPIDYLKIDGSFIKDMINEPIDRAMVESINRIGQVMGIKTIAEWVEDDAILNELKKMGVDYVQGYAIGYPEPLDKIGLA